MVVDHQNAFDSAVHYNVLDIDGTFESPNQLLDTWVIPQIVNVMITLEAEHVSVYTVTL